MNIILFGFKSCGKTTCGKKVAKKLNKAFIDTDSLIEKNFYTQTKKEYSCSQIYQAVGPQVFRAMEKEAIDSLQDIQNSVIAVGGGAILDHDNFINLNNKGLLFYLEADFETLRKRILSEEQLPAYLNPENPEASLERIYEERKPYYEKIPAFRIDVAEKTEDNVVEEIIKQYQLEQKNGQ